MSQKLFVCMCVLVAQSCLTLCNPMDYCLRGSSVPGILQERILEWVAILFSREFSQPRDRTWVSHIAGRFFTIWTTREAQNLLRRICIWSFLCDPAPLFARKRWLPISRACTVIKGGWKMNSLRRTFPEAAFPCITHNWAYSARCFKTGWEDQHRQFSSVQSLSHIWLFVTPWTAARQASLSITNSKSLLKLMSIELIMPSNHLILCRSLLLPPSSFPASGSFQMSQCFTSGGQNIGVSALASILPMNIQDWFPLGWTGWIYLQTKGLSRIFSNTTVQKHQFFGTQLSLQSNSHIHTWLLEKP